MEWGAVGGIIVAILFGAGAAIKDKLSGRQKETAEERAENERQRKRLQRERRKAFKYGDLFYAWAYEVISAALRFNAGRAETDQFPMPKLPAELDQGVRLYVGDEEDEDGEG